MGNILNKYETLIYLSHKLINGMTVPYFFFDIVLQDRVSFKWFPNL